MKHSPLPWRVEGQDIYGNEQNGFICQWSGRTADARFIVRACSHHEQIVSILKRVVAATTIGEYMDIADDSDRLLSELEADK